MDLRVPQLQGDAIRQELLRQYKKATSTSTDDVDLLAIDLFATMVQQYGEIITIDATKIIADKFRSNNADEVLLALNVLEECMSKCGPRFHSEVGKFRFLNELIRLVSPQYDGDKTPKKVRDKILDLMLLWTKNYPHEKKIKDAYDMLLKRGVCHEYVKQPTVQNAPQIVPPLSNENTLREKAEPDLAAKLQGLLHSSNPADIKAANLLIQNMVKEKERRQEVKMRRKLELNEITENASLLMDMLGQVEAARKNGVDEETTEDVLATMKYLYESCKKLQPTISILLGDTEETECLQDALDASEFVNEVFQKYHRLIIKSLEDETSLYLINTSNPTSTACNQNDKSTMDELNEIFASSNTSFTSNGHPKMHSYLEPTSICSRSVVLNTETRNLNENRFQDFNQDWQVIKDLRDEPVLSSEGIPTTWDQLLNSCENMTLNADIPGPKAFSIPSTATNAISTEKVNATQLKFQNFDAELTEMISGLKSSFDRDDDRSLLQIDLEPIKSGSAEKLTPPFISQESTVENHGMDKQTVNQTLYSNKPLADIVIDLNKIRPHDIHEPRCILDVKSGLKITLNFAKDKPRADVAVLVITTTNQSHLPVKNYQFEASVSKPCKLHLQKPSGYELPGVRPFRPPIDNITEVLLISNAERKALKLVCIISYVLGDDPDPNREFLEINDLPDIFS